MLSVSEDRDVGIGHCFERRKSAGNNKGRKRESEVLGIVRGWPEGQRATAVEGETEEDTVLVTETRCENSGDRREDDVSSKVCNCNRSKGM